MFTVKELVNIKKYNFSNGAIRRHNSKSIKVVSGIFFALAVMVKEISTVEELDGGPRVVRYDGGRNLSDRPIAKAFDMVS